MPESPRHRTVLAMIGLLLGAMALAAGEPRPDAVTDASPTRGPTFIDRRELVTALELARWIRDRREGLQVLDVREEAAFHEGHVPGAELVDRGEVAARRWKPDEVVVLYADDVGVLAPILDDLREREAPAVFVLEGGFREWTRTILNPVVPALVPWTTRGDTLAREEWMALSRWFGGMPTTPGVRATDDPARVVLRRGC